MNKPTSLLLLTFFISGCTLIRGGQPAAEQLRENDNFLWATDTTAHFVIYFESPAQIAFVRRDVEDAYNHIERLLAETYLFNDRMHVFIVSSREEMRALIGVETNGIAFPETNVLCYIVSDDMMLSARHELLHIMAMKAWGKPRRWLNEGLAVYADDHWHNHALHNLAGYFADSGVIVPLNKLMENFQEINDLIAYPEAGSIVKYIYETYGAGAVKALWQGASIESATGLSLSLLEKAWRDHLPVDVNITYEIRQ